MMRKSGLKYSSDDDPTGWIQCSTRDFLNSSNFLGNYLGK